MTLNKRWFSIQPITAWDYFEFDAEAQAMTVVYRDGLTKRYEMVSDSLWTRLIEARSKTCFIRKYFLPPTVTTPPKIAAHSNGGKD